MHRYANVSALSTITAVDETEYLAYLPLMELTANVKTNGQLIASDGIGVLMENFRNTWIYFKNYFFILLIVDCESLWIQKISKVCKNTTYF